MTIDRDKVRTAIQRQGVGRASALYGAQAVEDLLRFDGVAPGARFMSTIPTGDCACGGAGAGHGHAHGDAALSRGIQLPGGRTIDAQAWARGLAASARANARRANAQVSSLNARNAEFWAKQAAGGAR